MVGELLEGSIYLGRYYSLFYRKIFMFDSA